MYMLVDMKNQTCFHLYYSTMIQTSIYLHVYICIQIEYLLRYEQNVKRKLYDCIVNHLLNYHVIEIFCNSSTMIICLNMS